MTLLTLATTETIEDFSHVDSFIVSKIFAYTVAAWWEDVGGDPATVSFSPIILDVIYNYVKLQETEDYAQCQSVEGSWFYDAGDTQLFIHYPHGTVPEASLIQYGKGQGFCDSRLVYIDNSL